jgi:hypothetical protein
MANTVCEQDLIGFNFHNSGYPLTVGLPETVNDALYIDTRAVPNYAGVVTLNIGFEIGMTAVFASNGLTNITIPVTGNQLIAVPLIVTATDCGYTRTDGTSMYWQFTITYGETPAYGVNTGGTEPEPCSKPNRSFKVCRFDAKIQNKCYADFEDKIVNVPQSDALQTITLNFDLGVSPQCTGPVSVFFTTECTGQMDFDIGDTPGVTYTLGPAPLKDELTVDVPYGFEGTQFNFVVKYDVPDDICQCTIRAIVTYDNQNNPNLIVNMGNNGTFDGLLTQTAFNTAGVLARTSTVFSFAPGDSFATALKVTVSNPVDQTAVPNPSSPVNPTGIQGSIFWQGDISNPETLSTSTRYWLKAKMKQDAINPVIKANEELHVDKYNITQTTNINAAVPFLTQYSPTNQWLDLGLRFITTAGANPQITPMVRYVNTFANGVYTSLIGDLYLNNGSVSDWAELELVKYYPTDPIECPARYLTFKTIGCDYETILELDFAEGQDCIEIQLNDNSLFGYKSGHDQSDFNLYRKVTITLPDGSQQVLSSIAPYDILINPASVNPLSPFTTFPVSDGGYYEFTMCNVPTFRTDVAYQVDDCVCLIDGTGAIRFFQCIASRSGITPLVTGGWENYWTEIPEDGLEENYCDTQTYSNFCFLDDCINEYRNRLYCSVKEFCNVNICDNECIQNYLYLLSVKQYLDNDNTFANQRDVLNYLKKLCSTCNCQ